MKFWTDVRAAVAHRLRRSPGNAERRLPRKSDLSKRVEGVAAPADPAGGEPGCGMPASAAGHPSSRRKAMNATVDPTLVQRRDRAVERAYKEHNIQITEPNAEILQRLERAVLKMPRLQCEIFLAHRLDNMTYVEIAERTGLTVDQVMRQMAKAIYTLSRCCDQDRLPWWHRWFH